jgi:predicted DNA-binding transcriptional regulator AlpA
MSVSEAERRQRQREESAKKSALSAELIEANLKDRAKAALAGEPLPCSHDRVHTHGARGPPPLLERLLSKPEVLTIANLSYPTIWTMMRQNKFPRSRIVGGKSMWLASEVNDWLAALPRRPLKGDAA